MTASRASAMKRSKVVLCTACSAGNDAELLHPVLSVPICGACLSAIQDADQAIENHQIASCVWCGGGDGCELYMCDTCVRSFCVDCVERNFGQQESDHVRELSYWSCYVCVPTKKLELLQGRIDIEHYYSIDKAYSMVHPPRLQDMSSATGEDLQQQQQQQQQQQVDALTDAEYRLYAMLTRGCILEQVISRDIVSQYLTAIDLSVVHRLSKQLHRLSSSSSSSSSSCCTVAAAILPGLFRNSYDESSYSSSSSSSSSGNNRLYAHQQVSLQRMLQIENQSTSFGALRGGILGDEPGLGEASCC